jgi:hypothetical protein
MARLVLTGMAVLACAACSSNGGKHLVSPPASTLPVSSTGITTEAQLEATILSDWMAAERASTAAAKDPTGSEVLLLVDHFVDPALSFLRTQYAANARDGLIAVGDIDPGQPRVANVSSTQAVVTSCATNSLQLVYRASGKPFPGKAGDPTPTPNGIRATMTLAPSGVWKVMQSSVEDGSCTGL